MKYIIRGSDGTEYGPVDQDVILKWVEDGRVTEETEIRNTLMKTWTQANKLPFVKELLQQRAQTAAAEVADTDDDGPREAVDSLNQAGRRKFLAGGPIQRSMAWLFDLILTVGVGIGVYYAIAMSWDQLPDPNEISVLATVGIVFYIMLYYIIGLGFKAQTFGQWFWGIMIVRPDGRPVYPGRAFIYTLLYFVLFPTTPIFWVIGPKHRSLQELLSGTRIIKITLRSS